jgi:hypothetical protein
MSCVRDGCWQLEREAAPYIAAANGGPPEPGYADDALVRRLG